MPNNIKVLIVDDHEMVRRGLCDILKHDDHIHVVGEAANGLVALGMVDQHHPNVVILDIRLPSINGIEVARQIKQQFETVKILCISSYEDDDILGQALQVGADGFALKTISAMELRGAIKGLAQGDSFVQQSLVAPLFRGYAALVKKTRIRDCGLTDIEVDVLRLLEAGHSNVEIAERFFWSDSTVKRKLRGIFDKMGAQDKVQAVATAIRRGIL